MTEPNDRIEDVIGKLERAQQNVCIELRRAKSDLTVTEVDLAARDRKIADLEREKAAALKQAADTKAVLDMYAKAWMRELGPFIAGKAHEIDALVVGTQQMRKWAEERNDFAERLAGTQARIDQLVAELGSRPTPAAPTECGDVQGTSSFGPVRCRLPQGHDGEHTDDVTAARFLPGARTVWPRAKKETP